MDSANPLNYAPPELQPSRWKKRLWRIAIALIFISVAIFWGPGLYHRLSYDYWEYEVSNLTLDSTKVAETVTFSPKGSFVASGPPAIPSINRFSGASNQGVLFAHRMTRPDGVQRLLIIHGILPFPSNVPGRLTCPWQMEEVEVEEDKDFTVTSSYPDFVFDEVPRKQYQFFYGAIDPSNGSHFTIDYLGDGQRHTIDAWIDNHDSLSFSIRP